MYNINNNLQILKSQLPKKPYCANNLSYGLKINNLNEALNKRYLQLNNPAVQHSLIFDIDIDNGFFAFEKNNAPAPNIIIKNPKNGRCHYIYQLQKGIYKNKFESLKATKYAAAIERGLTVKLEADRQYVGLVAKNPFCEYWQTEILEENLYNLDYLADFVDLTKPKEKFEQTGLGRNCNLFEDLRQLAYRKKRNFDNFDSFFSYLLINANNFNVATNTNNLLPSSEVKAISKSIAKWCFKHFNVAASDLKFSNLQKERRKKGIQKFMEKLEIAAVKEVKK